MLKYDFSIFQRLNYLWFSRDSLERFDDVIHPHRLTVRAEEDVLFSAVSHHDQHQQFISALLVFMSQEGQRLQEIDFAEIPGTGTDLYRQPTIL